VSAALRRPSSSVQHCFARAQKNRQRFDGFIEAVGGVAGPVSPSGTFFVRFAVLPAPDCHVITVTH
jgi:hypothetical protein